MSIKDLAEEIMEKMYMEGYYSEIELEELKNIFMKFLSKEYRGKLKQETARIESMIKEPTARDYQEAYDKVENHLIESTRDLAATSREDLGDL